MEQQHSFRSTLVGWLKEIVPYNKIDIYTRKVRENITLNNNHFSGEKFEELFGRDANSVTYIFCTDNNQYRLSATAKYLGCIATSRKCRAGETWFRGNDLPDGKFHRDTWEAIKAAIIRYEMVKLDPITQSGFATCGYSQCSNPVKEDGSSWETNVNGQNVATCSRECADKAEKEPYVAKAPWAPSGVEA